MSDEDRTFDPTPQRREQFRKEGRFARSRDLGAIAGTGAAIGALLGARGAISAALDQVFTRTLGNLESVMSHSPAEAIPVAAGALASIAGPVIGAAAIGGVAAGLAQSGLRLDLDLLSVKADRFNPFPKLKEIVSPKHFAKEIVLSLLRVGVVGYVGYRALLVELPRILGLARSNLADVPALLADTSTRLTLTVLLTLAIIAAIDYAQSRFTIERQLKMTRKELIDETRSQEGDPKLKARIRARARAAAKRRAMLQVKKADVVVVNPTHVAVALRYGEKDAAPIVVAKGHDEVALQIRSEARKHGVPILENRPLARALDAEVPVGKPIPAAHFAAVARVLAFVYRLKSRDRGAARA